jgi:hypothetical protein
MGDGAAEVASKGEHLIRDQTIAGLIVVIIGPLLVQFIGWLAKTELAPVWYVGGIGLVALFASVIYPPWRRVIWGSVSKWRPLSTQGTLDRAHAAGRNEFEAELEAKRRRPLIRAQWLIGEKQGQQYTWELRNMAQSSTARNVSIVVDSAYFRTASAMDWGKVDGGTLVEFTGALTSGGRSYDVTFGVSWTDANDEDQTAYVQVEARYGY